MLIFAIGLSAQGLFAQSLKKVMILDFKNLDKNPDYTYLEDSITEAVRNDLKAKFDFREMQRADWQKLAEKNLHLWPEDNYTRSFGLHIGAVARQDIVVGGYYQAIIEKKASKGVRAGSLVIRSHVFVIDIGQRKIVSEFDMIMPADASLFSKVEELAARVVTEAKSVLPNKGDAPRAGFDDGDVGPHEMGLIAGTDLLSQPASFAGNYTSSTTLYAKDFAASIMVSAFYAYHDFLWPRGLLHIMAGAHFASTDLTVAGDSKKLRASLLDVTAAGHLGYEFRFWRFCVTPLLGGGFSVANAKLDYGSLSALPVAADGTQRSGATLNFSAPFAEGGLRLSFSITELVLLQLYGLYRESFYVEQSVGQIFGAGGVGFRL